MCGIYKITNKINGKVYIGQSTNIHKRWAAHKTSGFNKNKPEYNYPLYQAIRKYGLKSFLFEILEECLQCELNDREIYYIALYNSNNSSFGYNQNEGGQNAGHAIKLSAESVIDIINELKVSSETNQLIAEKFGISERMVRSINYGECWPIDGVEYPIRYVRSRSPNGERVKKNHKTNQCEICGANICRQSQYCVQCANKRKKDKLKKAQYKPTPLALAKLIKENGFEAVGRMFSVSGNAIVKWCKSYNIPSKNKELVAWYNQQMGIELMPKQKKKPEDYMKAVKQIDTDTGNVLNVFRSVNEAARAIGNKKAGHIIAVCKGRNKTAYGYVWQYD